MTPTEDTRCARVREALATSGGAADGTDAPGVVEHLERCSSCTAEARAYATLREALAHDRTVGIPPALDAAVRARLSGPRSRARWAIPLAAAVGSIALLLTAIAGALSRSELAGSATTYATAAVLLYLTVSAALTVPILHLRTRVHAGATART